MLPHFAQYSPQGLLPQFYGLQAGPQFAVQGIGSPLMEQYPFVGQPNPFALSQIVPMLGQLAQQVAVQSAVTQQIGAALHQLAQQLAIHGQQSQQGLGLNAGQAYGGAAQVGFGGFNPQAQQWGIPQTQQWGIPQAQPWGNPQVPAWGSPNTQAWGANRSQTIQ